MSFLREILLPHWQLWDQRKEILMHLLRYSLNVSFHFLCHLHAQNRILLRLIIFSIVYGREFYRSQNRRCLLLERMDSHLNLRWQPSAPHFKVVGHQSYYLHCATKIVFAAEFVLIMQAYSSRPDLLEHTSRVFLLLRRQRFHSYQMASACTRQWIHHPLLQHQLKVFLWQIILLIAFNLVYFHQVFAEFHLPKLVWCLSHSCKITSYKHVSTLIQLHSPQDFQLWC